MNVPQTEKIYIGENNGIPNNPEFPALVYRSALKKEEGSDLAARFEQRFRRNGWGGCWRWGVYSFHHFHSNAHEVLGVARGEARLTIGGPEGRAVRVEAGDMLLLPPGTGHRNEGSSPDFLVVGAYPHGQEDYDLIRGGGVVDEVIRRNIAQTPVPEKDPFFGSESPAVELWKSPKRND